MTNPLFTIIVTTFNRKNLLPYAIQSILEQTYSNYEIIVVNDCGEDVWDIIQSFSSKKILYLSTIKNSGPACARNIANNIAKGEYICYLDDDDLFLEDHLDTLVRAYENNNADVVYTDALLVLEKIENNKRMITNTKKMFDIPNYSYQQLLIQNFIPINCISHKRSLFSKVGFFMEELDSLEDWEFLLRLGKNKEFYHISRATVEVRRNINSINNISSIGQINAPIMYRKIYDLHKVDEEHIEIQRCLVILRIIKDNIISKKNLRFIVSQLYLIQKEIRRLIHYSFLNILK